LKQVQKASADRRKLHQPRKRTDRKSSRKTALICPREHKDRGGCLPPEELCVYLGIIFLRVLNVIGAASIPKGSILADSNHRFSKIATKTAIHSGRPWAFVIAALLVAGWLIAGPVFHFSDTWQLVMNTVSSIVTFLMVFLIQNAQNRDSSALQVKLDEVIRVIEGRRELMGVERLSQPELDSVRRDVERRGSSNDQPYAEGARKQRQ
jgi:low affinity Fe/Cu permease